ncbi:MULTISPECIES: PLDc N-terminal domain-containing protein [unclassified Microbacterium]|uniref:PLDc N-terminal domain-containing protein n=1 Tax=unclassified Microbacterium TaxID=2609290 RepID=UPI003017D91A
MVRILLPALLLLIAFWVYSIVDCALLSPTRHRGVSKPVWLLIVVLLPVLGGILWFVVGRGRIRVAPAYRAPDDNPDFLGRIGSVSDQDERIRRLEAELAALDAEDPDQDGPGRSRHGGSGTATPSADDDGETPPRAHG